MNFRRYIKEAIRQLTASKLRAFLAVLGILVGTASVVAMISIGELSEAQVLAQFKSLGINLLSVSVYPEDYSQQGSANPYANLSLKAASGLGSASDNIQVVAPYVTSYGNAVYRGKSLEATPVGITTEMANIAKLHLQHGRMLSFLDANDYFCVIGNSLYKNIIKAGAADPIGTQIQVGNNIFTVVGVLQKWPMNFFFNTNFNNAILLPIETALSIQKNAKISNIALRINNPSDFQSTETDIKNYVNKHTIKQQVMVRSPKSLVDSMKQSAETLTLLLGMIGSISLIVGGIGVMNIMLVSVAERRREIGIRMAIGAKPKDIIMQFLMEAVVLSIFGGVVGMLLGVIVTYAVALIKGWHFSFFIFPPLAGCLITIIIGIFFGFYPALKASKLDPIQTLRSD